MMNHNLSPFSGSPDSAKIEHQSPYINTNNLMAIPPTSAPAPTKTKAKPRKRVNTAEKRHQHNAVERQRRETLNSKFIVLARLLPALANHRRPSKSAIVNGSISHMTKQRDQRLLAATLLRQLCAERDTLAKECNEWRAASGFHSKEVAKKAWTEEMEEVCMVENETFGEFANMGEEGDDDQDQEGQDSQESYEMGMSMDIGQATAAVASFNNTGLITTRSSTDIDPLSLALGISSSVPTQTRPATTQTAPVLTHSQSMPVNWHSTFPFASAINMNSNVNMNNLSPDPIAVNSLNGTGILPFNAFMTDSLDSLSSSPSGSMHNMPTPPTSNDFSRFTHTPSPRSSGSYEDGSKAMPIPQLHSTTQRQSQAQQPQWTAQQLLFLHSVQQQQLQEAHIAEMQSRGMPVSTAAASAAAGNSFPARSASSMSVGNDLPENFVHQLQTARASLPLYPHSAFPPPQHLQQLQQQQQQQQQQFQQQLLQQQQQQQQQLPGLQGMPRMSLEQLEAWRNVTGSNNAGLGMGLWTQSQGQNATVKGF